MTQRFTTAPEKGAAMGGHMKKLVSIFLVSIFLASGCASLQELSGEIVKAGKTGNAGVSKVYPVNTNQAWDIARAVFCWEKTDEIYEHRNENYMITSTGMKMVAFGSVMGVWIEPVDADNTKVTVVTKRRVENDFFTKLNEATFFERFEQGMKIVKGGKHLPVVPPVK
jgi:hypothetical protein